MSNDPDPTMKQPTRNAAPDAAHRPDDAFVRQLEWQTRSLLRRAERFGPERSGPETRSRGWTLLRAAVLALGAALLGGGAVLAAQRIEGDRELRILLERNRVQLALAERRTERAEEERARLGALFEAGFVSSSELAEASRRVADATGERAHLALERAEMEAARREPDRTLSAPRVGGRDFVSEHLRVEVAAARERLALLEASAALVRERFRAGHVPQGEVERAEADVGGARLASERIEARLALRAEFLAGRIGAAECERRDLVLAAESRQALLRTRLAVLDAGLRRMRTQFDAGMISRTDLTAEEARQAALAAELELVALELELLE